MERKNRIVQAFWAAALGFLVAGLAPAFSQDYRTVPDFRPLVGLENPAAAIGLNGISDWSTQQPFVNIMKTARPWIGHLPGQWGGVETAELVKSSVLDKYGWPTSVPANVTSLESFILTDQPQSSEYLKGRYRLTYVGSGEINLSGRARNIVKKDHEIWFDYTPGEGLVGVVLTSTDPRNVGDYIRDIAVVHAQNIPLYEVGAVFNPLWIARIEDFRLVRFMDWMMTNDSPQVSWQDRPRPADFSYAWRGVPVEIMVELGNRIGADPWFNMPHQAKDSYIRSFAEYVQTHLDPGLNAHVEYSNELWNFIFGQAKWAQEQAQDRWQDAASADAWMQFVGMRAAEVADIWSEVFAKESGPDLTRIIATHTGWQGLEQPMLNAPLWVAESRQANKAPKSHFDGYAITGYFGQMAVNEDMTPQIAVWAQEGEKQGQKPPQYYPQSDRKLADWILEHALQPYLKETLPYHAKIARENNLDLMMYEGGSHVAANGPWINDRRVTDYLSHFNYTPEIAGVFDKLLAGWRQMGGGPFNAFVDVAPPGKYGNWGALRNLQDDNPRFQVLQRYNKNPIESLRPKNPDTYMQGITRGGTSGADALGGTIKADILLGRAGDDILRSTGNGDRLHGGAGQDVAVLRGKVEDYRFYKIKDLLVADGPIGKTYMYSIESIRFVP